MTTTTTPPAPKLDVRYYATAAGNEPAREYVESLPEVERQPLLTAFAALIVKGTKDAGVTLKPLKGTDGLWEIKVGAQRVVYVLVDGPMMILLHAFRKASQKTPKAEIDTATTRAKDYRKRTAKK